MRIKIATDVPTPPPLTKEDLRKIVEEGDEFRKAFKPIMDAMETITAEDLRIRVR